VDFGTGSLIWLQPIPRGSPRFSQSRAQLPRFISRDHLDGRGQDFSRRFRVHL
jgi:hypothetical protein